MNSTLNLSKSLTIRLLVLCIVISVTASAVGWQRAAAAAIPPVVRTAAAEGRAVWIYLQDKGPALPPGETGTGSLVSQRALTRIALRGGTYNPEMDRPVYAPYREMLRAAGMTIRSESRWLNAVAGYLPVEKLEAVSSLACVAKLTPVAAFRHEPVPDAPTERTIRKPSIETEALRYDYGRSEEQVRAIQADRLHALDFDGTGVLIGFLDTGFDLEIDAFRSLRVVATWDFINDDADVGDDDASQMRHGTRVVSLCGGYVLGDFVGVAPRAEYALAKTEIVAEEIRIEEDNWVAGLEWADSLGCDILSSSLGYTDWYTISDLDGNTAPATIAADLAAGRGMLVVTAAGNEGASAWQRIIVPADGDSVLAVGASDLLGERVSFSSIGPTTDGRIKPDVLAPGINVWMATTSGESATYTTGNGTSFATPLVAGLCALLLQQDSMLSPIELIDRLRQTALRADAPDNLMGWGMVQGARAGRLDEIYVSDHGIEVWPNPSSDGKFWIVTPDFDTEKASQFAVYTVAGQQVYDGEFPRGLSVGRWLGTNQSGEDVASGIYLIWVKTPHREGVVKAAIRRAP